MHGKITLSQDNSTDVQNRWQRKNILTERRKNDMIEKK